MWGKDFKEMRIDVNKRITSAHAWKSYMLQHNILRRQDHPRTCGEKYILQTVRKLRKSLSKGRECGIIRI